jgi:hypothetical protein
MSCADCMIDQNIRSETERQDLAFVVYRHWSLTLEGDASVRQFVAQALAVD